ncbi:MAG: hypothetical protein Q9228_001468 [Teloschistes exilis]
MPPSKKDPYKHFLKQRKETAHQEYNKLVEDHRKGAEIILQQTQAVVNEIEIIRVPTQPSADFKEMANQLIHLLQPVHMLLKHPPEWMIQEHKDYQKHVKRAGAFLQNELNIDFVSTIGCYFDVSALPLMVLTDIFERIVDEEMGRRSKLNQKQLASAIRDVPTEDLNRNREAYNNTVNGDPLKLGYGFIDPLGAGLGFGV